MDDLENREIIVRSEAHLFGRAFVVTVSIGCLFVGLNFVYKALSQQPGGTPIIIIFCVLLILWAAASTIFILSSAWLFFGAQVVVLRGDKLKVEHKIGQISIAKPRTFSRPNIQDMKVERRSYGYKGKKVIKYVITFSYRGRTENLFSGLSERRANELLSGPLHEFVHIVGSATHRP
jgi:hypothetical protein